MEVTCECGEKVEVPRGEEQVECPNCGRTVRAEDASEWMESLSAEDLTLEEGAKRPATREEAALESRLSEPEEPGEEPPQEPSGAEDREEDRATEGRGRGPAARPVGGAARGAQATSEEQPPLSLPGLLRTFRDNPGGAIECFREGVEEKGFIIQLAVVFLLLAAAGAVAVSFLGDGGSVDVGRAAAGFFKVLLDLALASGLLVLLSRVRKGSSGVSAEPLGVVQGLAFIRILGFAVAAPFAVVLGVLLLVWGAEAPGSVTWMAERVWIIYGLVVFIGQAGLILPLLRLGCAAGAVLSAVMTYGGYKFAGKVVDFFAG